MPQPALHQHIQQGANIFNSEKHINMYIISRNSIGTIFVGLNKKSNRILFLSNFLIV